MSRIAFLLIGAILSVLTVSCSSENESFNTTIQKDKQHIIHLSELKRLSKYHSDGLDDIYNHLKKKEVRSGKVQTTEEEIKLLAIDFVRNHMTNSTSLDTRSLQNTEGSNGYRLSTKGMSIFNSYFDTLISSLSKEDAEQYVAAITQRDTFLQLSHYEQELLTFMMYIGIDSRSYWSNPYNWNKWAYLRGESQHLPESFETRGIAGPPASYWMTSKQMNNKRFKKILRDDCVGCLLSLIPAPSVLGWAIGGISNSAASAL